MIEIAQDDVSYENAKDFTITLGGVQLDSSIVNYYDTITVADAEWYHLRVRLNFQAIFNDSTAIVGVIFE